MNSPDDLYNKFHPGYFETQKRDLWFYERLWSVLLRQLGKRSSRPTLIEFGSGPGFLLALAKRYGWHAVGEEPSAVARRHADKLGVFSTDRGHFVHSRFGSAIATEVLEHVDYPFESLCEWSAKLVDGGYLAISVPNDNNPLQRLFGRWISPDRKTPKHWIHPTHKSYFTPRKLRELVEAAGFDVVWQRTSFPVELLLALPIPRKLAWKLSRLWPAPPLLWRLNIGRHILLVAKKA